MTIFVCVTTTLDASGLRTDSTLTVLDEKTRRPMLIPLDPSEVGLGSRPVPKPRPQLMRVGADRWGKVLAVKKSPLEDEADRYLADFLKVIADEWEKATRKETGRPPPDTDMHFVFSTDWEKKTFEIEPISPEMSAEELARFGRVLQSVDPPAPPAILRTVLGARILFRFDYRCSTTPETAISPAAGSPSK